MKRDLVVIAHNLRSAHNVGSILRTADGLAVSAVYLTGYTPYPKSENDSRLPHIAEKINRRISKTSLGAEKTINWKHSSSVSDVISKLRGDNYEIITLEQTDDSISLAKYKPSPKIAIILGNEVLGVETEILNLSDKKVSIPMLGDKESYNVAQAAAMALYSLRFH